MGGMWYVDVWSLFKSNDHEFRDVGLRLKHHHPQLMVRG